VTYKQKFQFLLDYCSGAGISVVLLYDDELKDYAGFNSEVGKILGFDMPENTVYLDGNFFRGGKNKARYLTLKHEIIEMDLMKKGMCYWDAHCISLDREKDEKIL
jgi:hypothetical protein